MTSDRLRIDIKTPLHIGDGESYPGFEYFLRNGELSRVDMFRALSDNKRFCNFIKGMIDGPISDVKRGEDSRLYLKRSISGSISQKQREELNKLDERINEDRQKSSLTYYGEAASSILNDYVMYSCKAFLHHSEAFKEIRSFWKQDSLPGIPGTGLKGAIRTAVLYTLADSFIDEIKQKLEKFRKKKADLIDSVIKTEEPCGQLSEAFTKVAIQIEHMLLRPSQSQENGAFDLFQFVRVADAFSKSNPRSFISNYLRAVNVTVVGRRTPVETAYELCVPGCFFLAPAPKIRPTDGQNLNIIPEEVGALSRGPDVFSFRPEQRAAIKDVASLFRACYTFANDLLDTEDEYFSQLKNPSVRKILKRLKSENTEDAPLIRLGQAQGFLSFGLGLFVKKNLQGLLKSVVAPSMNRRTHPQTFPQTRRLVTFNGEDNPLGWVKLSIEQSRKKC